MKSSTFCGRANSKRKEIRPQDSKLKSLKSNLLPTDGQYEDMLYSYEKNTTGLNDEYFFVVE